MSNISEINKDTFFDEVHQRCQFKYWFFGHYHEDMVIEKKYVMLYEQIISKRLIIPPRKGSGELVRGPRRI